MLNSAKKEQNCPMEIEGRESYKVKWQFSYKNAGNHMALHQLSEWGRRAQQSVFEGRATSVLERTHSVAGR